MPPPPRTAPPSPAWLNLVRAALATGPADTAPAAAAPESLATAVAFHPPDAGYDRAVFAALLQLAEQEYLTGPRSDETISPFSAFVDALDRDEFARLILAARPEEQRQFVQLAADGMLPRTALLVTLATAKALRQQLAPAVERLLLRLGGSAAQRTGGDDAEALLRKQIRRFAEQWWIVTEETGTASFDMFQKEETASRIETEPDRIVQIALETDAVGAAVWRAVGEMSEFGQIGRLIDMLAELPEEHTTAATIAHQLATPTRIRDLLRAEPVDFRTVDLLLEHLGVAGAPVLLSALNESRSRSTRRALFDRIVRIGPDAIPAVVEELKDKRWYVQRNMLAILTAIGRWPENLDFQILIRHQDARVRKEALRLSLQSAEQRDKALEAAIRDADWDIVRLGLLSCAPPLHDSTAATVATRLADPSFPEELLTAAAKALTLSNSAQARRPLISMASGGRDFLGRRKLAGKSPAMLAALTGLAAHWAHDADAARLIALASSSRDPQIRAAITPPQEGAP